MPRFQAIISLLIAGVTTGGCAVGTDTQGAGADSTAYRESLSALQDSFGDEGKADSLGHVTACRLLEPLAAYSERGLRSGYLVGVEGAGVLGPAKGFAGVTVAFDLYHHQMTVLKYLGAGLTVPGLGAELNAYHGSVTGFEDGVGEMDGYFATAELELGLPFIKDFMHRRYTAFVSAEDDDANGIIGPTELVLPPHGIYGYTKGVSIGFDLLPNGLPVGGSLLEQKSTPFNHAIRFYYDAYRGMEIRSEGGLRVRLVDADSGADCHPDWPDAEGERECVVEFGEPDWQHTRRGLHTAFALCAGTGGCVLPLAWKRAVRAIAVGALRDAGGDIREFCPDVEVGQELGEGEP
jgi:hypothetical protein